jgi:hypothetical protein
MTINKREKDGIIPDERTKQSMWTGRMGRKEEQGEEN